MIQAQCQSYGWNLAEGLKVDLIPRNLFTEHYTEDDFSCESFALTEIPNPYRFLFPMELLIFLGAEIGIRFEILELQEKQYKVYLGRNAQCAPNRLVILGLVLIKAT